MRRIIRASTATLGVLMVAALLSGCGDEENPTGPTGGSISATVSASGVDVPTEFMLLVDDEIERAVGATGTALISEVDPGDHELLLTAPTNCVIEGANPRSVSVAEGAVARTTFVVTCESTSGGGKPNGPDPEI